MEGQDPALILEAKIKKRRQQGVGWKKAGHLRKKETKKPTNVSCGSVSGARVSGISSHCSGRRFHEAGLQDRKQ